MSSYADAHQYHPDGTDMWRSSPVFPGETYLASTEVYYEDGGAAQPYGDYYRQSDDVTRGLTLDVPSADLSFPDACKGFMGGDAYLEHEEVHRSCKAFDETLDFDLKGIPLPPSSFGEGLYFSQSHYEQAFKPSCKVSAEVGRFEEGDHPPSVPSDPLFTLEMTTLDVCSCTTPRDIGNELLNFFDNVAVASVTKVCRRKYAIKAHVFLDAVMCTLKVRVYKKPEPDRYAVEFQRRSGDCVAFNNAYQMAGKHLQQHFRLEHPIEVGSQQHFKPDDYAEVPEDLAPALSSLPPIGHVEITEDDIVPLLEMAGWSDAPSIQAESASTLADLAKDIHTVKCLCNAHAFAEISKLLQSDQTEVAYPTAKLLAALALCPEASPCFEAEGLLPKILHKVCSKETCQLVKQQLAEALYSAVELCKDILAPTASQELIKTLSEALQDQNCHASIKDKLAKAHFTLRLQRA